MSAIIGSVVAFIVAGLAILGLVPHQQIQPIPQLPSESAIIREKNPAQPSVQQTTPQSDTLEQCLQMAKATYVAQLNTANIKCSIDSLGWPDPKYVQQTDPGKGIFRTLYDEDNNCYRLDQGNVDHMVTGMSKYTDPDFGFSFWYPSRWIVNVNGDSIDVKEQTGTYPRTVSIAKMYRSDGVIDASGACGSCRSIKYFFDKNQHAWMQIEDPVGTGGKTSLADVSKNTMGGLHILADGSRYGGSVVPLSARNFLWIIGDDGGLTYHIDTALTTTIVANDPSVATPVSADEQIKTIQAEKDAYAGQ